MSDKFSTDLIKFMDEQRASKGFLSIKAMARLCKQGNIILDFFSVLISEEAKVGSNNVFYPNVIIESSGDGLIEIHNNNVFHSNTLILADGGMVSIGDNNQFGDGGVSIKANMQDTHIRIENDGRYLNGAQVLGKTFLGTGSQIIGSITVQNCILEAGESYRHENPDERAGLLKGFGLARGLVVKRGEVIDGSGLFKQEQIKSQSFYHAK